MEPIWNWGNNLIVTIQAVHNPILDGFFNVITFSGEPEFFLLLFPLIIWSINKSIGLRLTYLGLISLTLNTWAKLIINHPRPYQWPSPGTSPVLKLNAKAAGPGLPSGHTQSSLTVWFYLAYHFRRPWLWLLATVLFILVSFSRVYLGVHFPTDLLGGAILGLVILLLFIKFEHTLAAWLSALAVWPQIGLALTPLVAVFIYPHSDIVATCGTLSGLSLGVIFDNHRVGFEVSGSILRRTGRFILGVMVLGLIYFGLKLIIPPPGYLFYLPLNLLRYIMSGFWVGGGAMWLFKRVKLD
ncbi:MAG: phosphatase PAP2 family protein [Dehalococcoidia bacterium]|nr:MAG: phosphatase PAP2 family protein [Dehalococcoidia bacterium]